MNASTFYLPTIQDGTIADCAAAVLASLEKVQLAAQHAAALLTMAGLAGSSGDTADDLRVALTVHDHLVHEFHVKVRSEGRVAVTVERSSSSYRAYQAAAAKQGDALCAITVTPASKAAGKEPDRVALEAAHRSMRIAGTLDDALKHASLSVALRSVARKKMRDQVDLKRLAANDHD